MDKSELREDAQFKGYNDIPLISTLISDDAPQFQFITEYQALCWIHEGRHLRLHP